MRHILPSGAFLHIAASLFQQLLKHPWVFHMKYYKAEVLSTPVLKRITSLLPTSTATKSPPSLEGLLTYRTSISPVAPSLGYCCALLEPLPRNPLAFFPPTVKLCLLQGSELYPASNLSRPCCSSVFGMHEHPSLHLRWCL